ncbi:helix-turn-helix transcriptional regulator [Catenovulum maritimum]|uniref:Uncharacterized protein n=1 Tax=Catenovulum maritimum TaxID=1513271 RepID=A0A0J8GV45_9ALTE|nr:WYL domain-containing protein [Catenovulum maritimum]KMT64543.1 hypothetical protein XM47_13890 [Catenovulum maritimum]
MSLKLQASNKSATKRFIEICINWQGYITPACLAKQFNYSAATAKRDLQDYKQEHPDYLDYNNSEKAWFATEKFTLHYSHGNLTEFAQFNTELNLIEVDQNERYFDHVLTPPRHINKQIFQQIYKACIKNTRLKVNYLSLKSDEFTTRVIQPHTIVFDGLRWHVRAYDEKNQTFLDLNLSRFSAPINTEQTFEYKRKTKQDDYDWQHQVELILVPDPRLSSIQKSCIETEFKMQNGELRINCRAALVKYLLIKLRIDIWQATPEAQQIILKPECAKQLKPYLPPK